MRKDFGAKPTVYPMPVLMIATYSDDGTPDVMNAAWGMITDASEITISLSEHKTTENLRKKGAFTVSMATEETVVACDYVGIVSAKDEPDKFAKAGFHAVKSGKVDAPLIEELPMALECTVKSYEDGILTGTIVNVTADESILTDGKIDPAKLKPITFDPVNNAYIGLGQKVGNAFQDGKIINSKRNGKMNIVCLDLEGVLVPEIWIAFAEASGIPELKRTTRDEPDYDKLMKWRLGILKEHGLGLKEIQETIAKIDPMPGAKEFLDELRSITQVIIISDTFTQFAGPLMKKLGWPTIFCNSLEVAENGEITGFKMRIENSKLTTVKALQSIGYDTIASGDSHNDLGMIQASKAGFLFRSTEQIKKDHPELPAYETYEELMAAIKAAL